MARGLESSPLTDVLIAARTGDGMPVPGTSKKGSRQGGRHGTSSTTKKS